MTIYAMRTGSAPDPTVNTTTTSANNINFDCPTNPLFVDTATLADTDRMFTYVSTATHSETFVQLGTAGTQYNNMATTEGYRISCYDEMNATGILANTIHTQGNPDDATHDYYVLIHSDNALLHHMAKITEVMKADVYGDSFEFEPRLGKQIPTDTKFMIFRGPVVSNTSIVAVSAGIRATEITAGSTYRMNKSLVCAKPLFYFYNDKLSKKNELDHNTKYIIKYDSDALADTTVDAFISNCFVTIQDYKLSVIDYSSYSMKASLIDNLRGLDDPQVAAVSNEGQTLLATDFTNYNECFYNIKRDGSDFTTNLVLNGPNRYIKYNYSPAKGNIAPNLIDVEVFESTGGRGGYAEAKMVDVLRILPSKIKEFDALRVRHQLHRGHFNEFFALKATVKSLVSGQTYIFSTDYDLLTLLADGDEILVGDKILTIVSIGAFISFTQQIEFSTFYRLETQSTFSQTYTLAVDDRLYRRAWSQSKGTLLTTFPIIENRNTNIKILLMNVNYEMLEATVTGSSVEYKTLTLAFDNVGYTATSALDLVTGDYLLEIERFEGEIEQIDNDRELGQNYMKLYGRDSYSKLISPIVNKNTLHSQDIIYSSNSPHNKLNDLIGQVSIAFNSLQILSKEDDHTTIDFTLLEIDGVVNGDKLFIEYDNGVVAYVGEVNTVSVSSIVLKDFPLASTTNISTDGRGLLLKSTVKNYMFNKALSSNNRLSAFPSSLTGSAEKGLFFESGIDIADDTTLISTSPTPASGNKHPKANGYHIYHPASINKSEPFEARLSDSGGGSRFATFDTVNTLMDFTVLNVSTIEGKTTIEIAPYVPLTLGRLDYNDADTYDNTLIKVGLTLTTDSSLIEQSYIYLDFSLGFTDSINEGDAVYIGSEFKGYCMQVIRERLANINSPQSAWFVYLDRAVTWSSVGEEVNITNYTAGKKDTHDLYLTNGEHLHGGKYVSMVNPTLANGSPTYFNAFSNQTNTTTVEKYGLPLYKLNHIEKGNFNYSPRTMIVPAGSAHSGRRTNNSKMYFYNTPSNIGYYASAYKTNHGRGGALGVSETVKARTTETSHEHLPIENRGYEPASGSLYFDYKLTETGHIRNNILQGPTPYERYETKSLLGNYDASAARLFLFATSDLMPYSSARTDSLFNSNRDLTKFKLFLLDEPSKDNYSVKQSNYKGTGNAKKYLDSSYQSTAIIEVDSPDLTKLKRMSLMRLTEVVFDGAFNQFNPEKPPPKNKTTYMSNIRPVLYQNTTVDVVSFSNPLYNTTINVSSSITLTEGDKLMVGIDDGTNPIVEGKNMLYIGTVAGTLGQTFTGTSFTLTSAGYYAKDGQCPTGTLHKIISSNDKYQIAMGHGKKQSFALFTRHLNFLKGLVHTDTYTHADITDEFDSEFGFPAGNSLPYIVTGRTTDWNYIVEDIDTTGLVVGMEISGSNIPSGTLISYIDSATVLTMDSRATATASGSSITIATNRKYAWATSNLVWPISLSGIAPNTFLANFTSTLIKQLYALPSAAHPIKTTAQDSAYGFLENAIHGVFLDTYSVEGGNLKIDKGTAFPPIVKTHLRDYMNKSFSSQVGTVTTNSELAFSPSYYTTPSASTVRTTTTKDAMGVIMGLKLRMFIDVNWRTIKLGAGNTTQYQYAIPTSSAQYLDFVKDLTGTYLVSEAGVEFNTFTSTVTGVAYCGGINNTRPTTIAYVISHEIETNSATKIHNIIVDTELPEGTYRVMQPNETAFYDFSPKDIKLSTLSSEYTKMAYEDKMYSTPKDYMVEEGSADGYVGSTKNHGHNEAVLSMYVGVDLDALAPSTVTPTYIVKRGREIDTYWNTDDSIPFEDNKIVCLSDGNNHNRTTLSVAFGREGSGLVYLSTGVTLNFGQMKEMAGVVSMSEIMTITTNKSIKGKPKRALIGSVVNICTEAEEIVNNLFEENDLEFTTNYTDDYPLFLAPNFKGVDLYSAVNYILEQKDKTLIFEDSKFKITDSNDSNNHSTLVITDRNDKYQIKDFSKSDVLFDFYNEITVYGATHSATKQHIRSIKSRGRKTLEFDDGNLLTLEDVENKASSLLKLHSTLNQKITLEVGHKGLSQLRAGDIITIELLKENLQLNQYQILQMRHTIGGFIRMELGRYSKGLEDRFAEILAEGKKTRALMRPTTIATNITNSFLEIPKIKELKLTILQRTTTGGSVFNLGFSTTIGFGNTMGVGMVGATTTLTTLLEDEL